MVATSRRKKNKKKDAPKIYIDSLNICTMQPNKTQKWK